MKTTEKVSRNAKVKESGFKRNPKYHFHVDEDFREDWDWGRAKVIASKAISKPKNSFVIYLLTVT